MSKENKIRNVRFHFLDDSVKQNFSTLTKAAFIIHRLHDVKNTGSFLQNRNMNKNKQHHSYYEEVKHFLVLQPHHEMAFSFSVFVKSEQKLNFPPLLPLLTSP